MWLGALVPRAMHPGGWTDAARVAGAEPLLTGRTRVYDESTLRRKRPARTIFRDRDRVPSFAA